MYHLLWEPPVGCVMPRSDVFPLCSLALEVIWIIMTVGWKLGTYSRTPNSAHGYVLFATCQRRRYCSSLDLTMILVSDNLHLPPTHTHQPFPSEVSHPLSPNQPSHCEAEREQVYSRWWRDKARCYLYFYTGCSCTALWSKQHAQRLRVTGIKTRLRATNSKTVNIVECWNVFSCHTSAVKHGSASVIAFNSHQCVERISSNLAKHLLWLKDEIIWFLRPQVKITVISFISYLRITFDEWLQIWNEYVFGVKDELM